MIVVDSTVWIDFLNGRDAPHVRRLRTLLGTAEIVVGDLMLCEILQGLASEREADEVEALLRRFEIAPMAGAAIAVAAARNDRTLRAAGVTLRKTVDLLIGTWCIENRRPLLHNDRDFAPMAQHLGLEEVGVGGVMAAVRRQREHGARQDEAKAGPRHVPRDGPASGAASSG